MNFDIYLHDTSHTCNGSHWIVGVLKKSAPLEEIVFLLKFFHFLSINRKWISSTFINQLIVLSRSVGFQNVSSYWFLYSNKILQWIPLGFVLFVMLTWPGRNRDGSCHPTYTSNNFYNSVALSEGEKTQLSRLFSEFLRITRCQIFVTILVQSFEDCRNTCKKVLIE